jgi:hypothetical protein
VDGVLHFRVDGPAHGWPVFLHVATAPHWDLARLLLGALLVDHTEHAPATRLLRWPSLGEALTHGYEVPTLWRRPSPNYVPVKDGRSVAKSMPQLTLPGFGRALLSVFRSGSLGNHRDAYEAPGVELAGSGHAFTLSHPERVAPLLAGFISGD